MRHLFCLCLICCLLPVENLPAQVANHLNYSDYYRFLAEQTADTASDPVAGLRRFISDHPQIPRAYEDLLKAYQLENRMTEAEALFAEFCRDKRCSPHSFHIYANLQAEADQDSVAQTYYIKAFQAAPANADLLSDYAHFLLKTGRSMAGAAIDSLPVDAESANVLRALVIPGSSKKSCARIDSLLSGASTVVDRYPRLLLKKGRCYFVLRDPQAVPVWERALALARSQGDLQVEAEVLITLGIRAKQLGEYDEAVRFYQAAGALVGKTGDRELDANISGNQGFLFKIRGDYFAAESAFKRAIKLTETMNSTRYLDNYYSGLASTRFYLGKYQEALRAYDRADSLAILLDKRQESIKTRANRGRALLLLGEYALAEQDFRSAWKSATAEEDERLQILLSLNLTEIALLRGEMEISEARKVFENTLSRIDPQRDRGYIQKAYNTIAGYYLKSNDLQNARRYFSKSREIAGLAGWHILEAWQNKFIADIDFREGKLDSAAVLYRSVATVADSVENLNLFANANEGLGDTYRARENPDSALIHYSRAVRVIEASRDSIALNQLKLGQLERHNSVFQKLAELYFERYQSRQDQRDLDSLYFAIEKLRGRSFQDDRRQRSSWQDRKNQAGYPAYQAACRELRHMQAELRRQAFSGKGVDQGRSQLLADLNLPRYAVVSQRLRMMQQIRGEPADSPKPQQAALENLAGGQTALLLYHISRRNAFVLAGIDGEWHAVSLPLVPDSLNRDISRLMKPFLDLGIRDLAALPFHAALAHKLYKQLVAPLEAKLKLPKHLIVIPDIPMLYLPLEMLLTAAPGKPVYTPAEAPGYADDFLQHRYTFSYAPTTSVISKESGWRISSPRVLAFANPFNVARFLEASAAEKNSTSLRSADSLVPRSGWRFDPLPFTNREVSRIAELYPKTTIYTGEEATKARFFDTHKRYDIIHFATHGFIDTTFNDAFSGLVMAEAHDLGDDGMLMGYEIADLQLNCELVTLSACETGRGTLVAGEGVIGLPRLFLNAGAKSVMMTLWKVDDRFTSELMPAFYEQYLDRGFSRSEALARAKRTMINRASSGTAYHHQHPLFWAAFTLYGNPGSEAAVQLSWIIAIVIGIAAAAAYLAYRRKRIS